MSDTSKGAKPTSTVKPAGKAKQKVSRKRISKPYPTLPLKDVILLSEAIFKEGSGLPVRRLTVFDTMGRSPESGAGRELVTTSGKYGLVTGSYSAEFLELTELGKNVVDPEVGPRIKARSKIECAISNIEIFKNLYETLVSKKLPSRNFLLDAFGEEGVAEKHREEAVDTFVLNLQYVGLLQTLSGSERIVSIDAALDEIPSQKERVDPLQILEENHNTGSASSAPAVADFGKSCFIITPIGDEHSEERRHADLILGSYIEPAVEEFGLNVIRADKIQQSGMITRQIIDYLVKSELVIADLSFSNPNVFYELAIRHAVKKPVIQIIRDGDKLPFDVNQLRTVKINLSDVYTAIPQVSIVQTELRALIRQALENPGEVESPISVFYPSLKALTLE